MKRIGSCIHCGNCCAGCELLVWKAVRDIKNGETITGGVDFVSTCKGYGTSKEYKEQGCATFPPQPQSVPFGCGYRWEDDE